ncbi:hypothetical protein BDZ94DRAFT_114602 [Collybia nuda]|uniref:Uncharacterized protein n=1 Tax=Collybia nuda TaxID=64659 RepID=A0A9P5XV46_9AGAR|nr:hypothetical protein BDZ94DRAFT_114602 [Collybia nuda]
MTNYGDNLLLSQVPGRSYDTNGTSVVARFPNGLIAAIFIGETPGVHISFPIDILVEFWGENRILDLLQLPLVPTLQPSRLVPTFSFSTQFIQLAMIERKSMLDRYVLYINSLGHTLQLPCPLPRDVIAGLVHEGLLISLGGLTCILPCTAPND